MHKRGLDGLGRVTIEQHNMVQSVRGCMHQRAGRVAALVLIELACLAMTGTWVVVKIKEGRE